jgi:Rieske Fe-S protein
MEKKSLISRKTFFRILSGLVLGGFVWIWNSLSRFQEQWESNMEFRHGNDLPMGVNYFEKYYLFRNKESVRAFSTTCTHAGCRIGKNAGTVLQCNCHGSQFDAETGKPLKGPAIKPLAELECRFDEKTEQWVVRLLPIVTNLSRS